MSAVWSAVTVAFCPLVPPDPACDGDVVVVVDPDVEVPDFPVFDVLPVELDEAALDWFASSSANLASSAFRVDSSDDTVSLNAVVLRVPSVSSGRDPLHRA